MASIEILRGKSPSQTATAILEGITAAMKAAGEQITETRDYKGKSDWLVLFGVGAEPHDIARNKQRARGGRTLMFDLGYFDRKKVVGHVRMSIDHDHPQAFFDRTPSDSSRWEQLGVELREDYAEGGHIILVGLGRKSRSYLNEPDWEVREFDRIRKQYPGRRIVYRPKPGHPAPEIRCDRDEVSTIQDLLRGASLAACRHSNVAIDATVAGVPFECIDGAAMWLRDKPFTPENRLDFLRRLAWWQWTAEEAPQAWEFAKRMAG